ncbi:MAG: YggS family pyridoxal phosphate-dependent enzyme, partial [Pyrinomonadaceae bacterium]
MGTNIQSSLEVVQERIRAAARRARRDPDGIKLVAVSKTHPVETIRDAISVGVAALGENKVQEAEAKVLEVGPDQAEWHFLGHLQSNKARKAVELFDVIQSLDSVTLAKRLERICIDKGRSELPVFVEVDLAGESTKSGIGEDDLPQLVRMLRNCICVRFVGLMALPPYFEDPEDARPYFRRLRELRDELQADGAFPDAPGELSMGMSHDLKVAIEEGATVVR